MTRIAELAVGTNESVFQGYLQFEYLFEVVKGDLHSWSVTIHLTDKQRRRIGKALIVEPRLPGTPYTLQPAWCFTDNLVLEGTLLCTHGTSLWELGADGLIFSLAQEQQIALEFEGNIVLFNAAEPAPSGASGPPSLERPT